MGCFCLGRRSGARVDGLGIDTPSGVKHSRPASSSGLSGPLFEHDNIRRFPSAEKPTTDSTKAHAVATVSDNVHDSARHVKEVAKNGPPSGTCADGTAPFPCGLQPDRLSTDSADGPLYVPPKERNDSACTGKPPLPTSRPSSRPGSRTHSVAAKDVQVDTISASRDQQAGTSKGEGEASTQDGPRPCRTTPAEAMQLLLGFEEMQGAVIQTLSDMTGRAKVKRSSEGEAGPGAGDSDRPSLDTIRRFTFDMESLNRQTVPATSLSTVYRPPARPTV